MAMNRVQFQPGLSMTKFLDRYGTEDQCSVTSGTIFEATKLPLRRWFVAMHLLTHSKNNVSALELKRHLGVCYKSAWLILRLRQVPPSLPR